MSRTYNTLRLGEEQYRLRLTIRGQKHLAEQFGEDTLQTVLTAATDSVRMAALLEEALNWEGSGNGITDGEAFYDLLVDQGYCGQVQFSALAFDIAVTSGLMTRQQADQLNDSVAKAVEAAFSNLDRNQETPEAPVPFDGPTD